MFTTGPDWICLILLNVVRCNKEVPQCYYMRQSFFQTEMTQSIPPRKRRMEYTENVCTSMSRGSVVSTVTRVWAEQPRNCCLILGSSEAHSFLYLVSMRGSFSVAVKLPGQEAVYLPDVSTVFPCLHGVHRDTFTYIDYFYRCWHLKLTTLIICS